MTKEQQKRYRLLWLIRPEDSSNWEAEAIKSSTENQHSKGTVLSVTKFFICYTMAIAVTVFLSGLH